MSCTNMNYYRDLVAQMTSTEKTNAAVDSFTLINGLSSPQRNDVVLGICAAANLYNLNITTLSEISIISDLSTFVNEASSLDNSEKFEAGIKGFFTINYFPTTDRDTVFKGFYASADLSGVNIDDVAAPKTPPINAGKADPVW